MKYIENIIQYSYETLNSIESKRLIKTKKTFHKV
jgi:hypothetical protein